MRFQSQKEQLTQNTIEAENIRIEIGSGANEIKNRPVYPSLSSVSTNWKKICS
jgi:hypothetical protein